MTKGIGTTVGGILGLVCLFFLALTFFNSFIMRQPFPKGLRALVEMLVPPSDLFEPLVKKEINISEEGGIKELTYENKYRGRHAIELLFERVPDDFYHGKYAPQLQIEFKFSVEGDMIFTHPYQGDYKPFMGKHGSGLILGLYSCPEELPLKKRITCRIEIKRADVKLSQMSGKAKICIRKLSDL